MPIQFTEKPIPGVFLVEPNVFKDDRGFFMETYHHKRYSEEGIDQAFGQPLTLTTVDAQRASLSIAQPSGEAGLCDIRTSSRHCSGHTVRFSYIRAMDRNPSV